MNNLTCVHATNGIRVTNDGTAMLCCMSKEPLTDKEGNIASVALTPLDNILNGKKAIEIRRDLDAGIQHPNCQRCWDEEVVGVASKRIRDNDNYQFVDNSLKIAELNLGTACNLKCRTCSPWASSQWNKEFLLVTDHAPPKDEYDKMLYNLNHSYDDDSIFWESFKDKLSSVEQIDMYGGEPFMIKKQWELLQYSIDRGYSRNQTLHFNTNGTYFDYNKIEILKHFKQIDISVSIDGIGPQFEYQRHPAKWALLIENLKKFKECSEEYNWFLSACVTVTNHNIFNLDQILLYLHNFGVNSYANLLHDPVYYNIKNLRSDIKEELTKKYLTLDTTPDIRYWLEKVVSFMNSKETDHTQWLEFLKIVSKIDNLRNEEFKLAFPDYYNRIVYNKSI
jgi:MoaA/NifB/PqqE/SkfB family radical SAM enzyme